MCRKFLDSDPAKRLQLIRDNGRCFNCLKKTHSAKDCQSRTTCMKCQKKHNTLLHEGLTNSQKQREKDREKQTNAMDAVNCQMRAAECHASYSLASTPVFIAAAQDGKNAMYSPTNALHDNCSNITLIRESLATRLQLPREKVHVDLNTVNSAESYEAFMTKVQILDADKNMVEEEVRAYILPDFPETRAVNWAKAKQFHPHLKDFSFPEPFAEGECGILIGTDNANLMRAKGPSFTSGAIDGPTVTPTPLGLAVAGATVHLTTADPLEKEVVLTTIKKDKQRIEDLLAPYRHH